MQVELACDDTRGCDALVAVRFRGAIAAGFVSNQTVRMQIQRRGAAATDCDEGVAATGLSPRSDVTTRIRIRNAPAAGSTSNIQRQTPND